MKIIFGPQDKYILQIRTWLQKEMFEKKSYFYYSFIISSFDSNNFACYVDEYDNAIGYIDFTQHERFTDISAAVVQFEHQRKGIGRKLLETISQKVRLQGSVAISLICAPKSSASKWKRLGFKKLREIENHQILREREAEKPWLYKIIILAQPTTRKKS